MVERAILSHGCIRLGISRNAYMSKLHHARSSLDDKFQMDQLEFDQLDAQFNTGYFLEAKCWPQKLSTRES